MKLGWIFSPSTKLPGYIDGWTIANNATDATNDIDFGTGVCWISDRLVELTSGLTKRLDASWAAGTTQGGLFSGSKSSSTWYHCFAMYNPSTGAIDAGFDTSVSGANKPSGWNVRRVGSIQTTSGNAIRGFAQNGDRFDWSSPVLDILTSATSTSGALYTMTCPPGVITEVSITPYYLGSGGDYLYFTSPNQSNEAPDFSSGRILLQSNGASPNMFVILTTNTSSQIRVRSATGGTDTLRILTTGYYDRRGRN